MKKAFTLAEVLITITVIGIISAIILPVALHSRPDENIMKFKKAHNTLYQVINSLISSEKYYCNGDLGKKSDCETFVGGDDNEYFCHSVADLLSTKEVNCYKEERYSKGIRLLSNENLRSIATGDKLVRTVTPQTIAATKEYFDTSCIEMAKTMGEEIKTPDGIVYYSADTTGFGSQKVTPTDNNGLSETIRIRYFTEPNEFPANYADEDGFDISYKIYCIDIDGIPANATTTDCKNECPFGYGIRADGKILPGKRAEEWLAKDPQKED